MAGVRVSTLRDALGLVMRKVGFTRSAYPAHLIGRDAGSKVHRSYATAAPRRVPDGRQKVGVQVRTSLQVVALIQVAMEDPEGLDVDDAVEDAANAVLGFAGFTFDDLGHIELEGVTVAPHPQHPRIQVITLDLLALHTHYTPDTA